MMAQVSGRQATTTRVRRVTSPQRHQSVGDLPEDGWPRCRIGRPCGSTVDGPVDCENSVSSWSYAMTVGLPVSANSRDMSRTICCGRAGTEVSPQAAPLRVVGEVQRIEVRVPDVLRGEILRAVQHQRPRRVLRLLAHGAVVLAQRRDERVQVRGISGASPGDGVADRSSASPRPGSAGGGTP